MIKGSTKGLATRAENAAEGVDEADGFEWSASGYYKRDEEAKDVVA